MFLSAKPPCETGGPGGGRQGTGRGVGPQGRGVMQRWQQQGFLLLHLLHVPETKGAGSASCRGGQPRKTDPTPSQTLRRPAQPAL